MPIYQLSVEARNDLALIWLYISEQTDDDMANQFIDNLEETCRKISEMPHMGSPQDHLRSGIRRHQYKSYSIYYDTIDENHIVIRRFWHQSRDLGNLLVQ